MIDGRPIKDALLHKIADRQVLDLLSDAQLLRVRYECFGRDVILLQFALELETAARAIVCDCADRHIITWDDCKVIRNIIDHIGTGERMENIVW